MINFISSKDLEIIRKHQQYFPVDVFAIANELEINVYSAKDSKNISGKIVKNSKLGGKSGYAIFINENDPKKRQRFTIAHEIAHYLLHKDAIGDGIVDDGLYRSGLTNKQETEANKLAAEILMPWNLINKVMNKDMTIAELAETFKVSESAMSVRLGIPS